MENFNSSILILGMPGVGKTSVAQGLSNKLKYKFIDLDSFIEKKFKKTILDIFQTDGEDSFRKYEKICMNDLKEEDKIVLASGGGAINEDTLDVSLSFRYRIWLDATIDVISKRCEDDIKHRPLLYNTNNINKYLLNLYQIRKNFYNTCSNIIIDTTNSSIPEIVDELIIKINEIN